MKLRTIPLTFATLCLTAGAAYANCPDYGQSGEGHSVSSTSLYSETSFGVAAGGEIDLSNCSSAPGVGHVSKAPDFTFDYTRTGDYNVLFSTVGDCDTVILVNDAAGNWYWDDDSGIDAAVMVNNPESGYIDVWVGAYENDLCSAKLMLESFDR